MASPPVESNPAPLEDAYRQLEDTAARQLGRRRVRTLGHLLGDVVDRRCDEIERRWLERVQEDIARTPGIALTQLRDGIPDYLAALVRLLRRSRPRGIDTRARAAWARVARGHGITRVRIGFDIGQLIREFVALRHVIRDVAEQEDLAPDGAEALLADIFDAAITAAVGAYVEARDFQAHRRQAENLSFLTHELRNPLTAMSLAATQLRNSASPAQARAVGTLDRGLHRLSGLIDNVLLIGKLESGKAESRPVEQRLEQVVEPSIEAARATAHHKGLDFRVEYDPARLVRVDPALTRSAIQNLADNAAKYTDAGSVDVRIAASRGGLEVHVRDTCRGLSPRELASIFEPFKRGETRQAGTGLGLAIARRAIETQGGSIAAESPGPSGCHFWFRLPGASAGRAPRATAKRAPSKRR